MSLLGLLPEMLLFQCPFQGKTSALVASLEYMISEATFPETHNHPSLVLRGTFGWCDCLGTYILLPYIVASVIFLWPCLLICDQFMEGACALHILFPWLCTNTVGLQEFFATATNEG